MMLLLLMRCIKKMKSQYDKSVQPRTFAEGDLVLIYEQVHDKLGKKS
jgi:hypothetical protein